MSKKRIVAVVVARQGSTRLPGKGMLEIQGRPVVGHIFNRLTKMRLFDDVCLATSNLPEDRPLMELAEQMGVRSYAGHPEDVLERFTEAARSCNADVVVEVGGDCPFIDPNVTRRALDILEAENADYVTNGDPATFPDGIDIHAVRMPALDFAERNAVLTSQRFHPLAYFHRHRGLFKVLNFTNDTDLSDHRWTLDYEEDFELISRVFEELNPVNEVFTFQEVLALMERKPELREINRKWAPVKTNAQVPGYWLNKTYTSDLLNDIGTLAGLCAKLEAEKAFARLAVHYTELEDMAVELKARAEHFGKESGLIAPLSGDLSATPVGGSTDMAPRH